MTLRIDTSYQLDEKTIVGESLPSVYFDKVTIQKLNNTFFLKSGNSIKDDKATPSGIFLKIDLNLVLKDVYDGKNSAWFKSAFDKNLKSKIKVLVAQTTNQISTNLWGSLTNLSQIIDISKAEENNLTKGLRNGTNIQIFSLDELLGSTNSNSITERFSEPFSIPNGTLYSFNKQISFPSKQNVLGNTEALLIPENQEHLCYTAFTYYEDSTIKEGPLSKITQEYIIKDAQVVKQSSVFVTKDEGKIWTGPVHYHNGDIQIDERPFTGFMGGSIHNASVSQPVLERTIVKNSTIQDLRSLNILEENVLFKKPVELSKQKQSAVIKNSIFSDFFTSREADGTVDFNFAIDMNSLIRSKFVNSLNLKNNSIEKMMNYINIKSVKVYRVRVNRPTQPEEQLFSSNSKKIFNPVHTITKIQNSKMNKSQNSGTKKNKIGTGYKKVSEKTFLVDNDRELIIEAILSNGILSTDFSFGDGKSSIEIRGSVYTDKEYSNIIYMTGTDATVNNFKNQYFQYELEIIFEDNRSDYFSKLKSDIDLQIEKIKKVSQISSVNKNVSIPKESSNPEERQNTNINKLFDVGINKFTNSFIRDISYSSEIVNVSGDYWDEVPAVYLKAFDVLNYNEVPSDILNNASMTIRNMLSPISGDPEGYERVMKMLLKMSDALSRNILLSRKNYGSKNQKNTVSKSKASKNSNTPLFNQVKINHLFKESTIDTQSPNFFGNLFFKMSDQQLPNDTSGIRLISYEEFIEYKNAEMEKIYSSPNADISISTIPNAQMNLDITSYGYFTPSVIYNKKQKPLCIESVLASGENYVDMVVNSLTTQDNLNLNSALGKIGKTSLEKSTNELNGKLTNLFSIKYGVSVSTEEKQFDTFKPSISKNQLSAPTLNDVGGQLKSNKSAKKEASISTNKSANVLRSLLNTKLVLKNEKPSVNQFNPNVLSTDCDEPAQIISTLPNQLKSLVIAQDGNKNLSFSPSPGIRSDIISLIRSNPFSNSQDSYASKNLFENIAQIQYLSEYELNSNNSISIKDEKWKLLTKNVFEKARNSNRKILCRIVPYSNTKFNIYYDRRMPIIDPYFYIGESEENEIIETSEDITTQTNPLSMTFDNPQYQFTYFEDPSINAGMAMDESMVMNESTTTQRPIIQNTITTSNLSVSNMGASGGSIY